MAGLVGEIYFNEPKELIMGGRWGDEDICKGEGLIIIKTTPHFVFFKSINIMLNTTTKKYLISRLQREGKVVRRKKGGKYFEAIEYNCIQYHGYTRYTL